MRRAIRAILLVLATLIVGVGCCAWLAAYQHPRPATPRPATATAVPATATPVQPTALPPTSVPPTETPTSVPPTETPTSVPPTETPTSVPPTKTPTSVLPTAPPPTAVLPTEPPAAARLVIVSINAQAEVVTIANRGGVPQDMAGWSLQSYDGSTCQPLNDQIFTFPAGFTLAPGASVRVRSGPNAVHNPPTDLLWTTQNVWANEGDRGDLRDPSGQVVSSYGYGNCR